MTSTPSLPLAPNRRPPTHRVRGRLPGTALLSVLLVSGAIVSCARGPAEESAPRHLRLERELSALVERAVAGSSAVPGAMLRIEGGPRQYVWQGAAGVSDLDTGAPLRPEQTLRTASNTKTFVAAAILRLVEEDRIDLDGPITDDLLPSSVATLESDGYDVDGMTVRMLLQHTSGLWDFAASDAYLQRVLEEPEHRWTRAEQLAFATSEGEPIADPGERYHYSDTGYILLGEILAVVTGDPMNEALHHLLRLDAHGIEHTWFERLDSRPPSAPPRVHQYVDGRSVNDLDPSIDLYGGGGLVSTLQDLTRFYRILLDGELFRESRTLDTMLRVTPESIAETGGGYGMGIARDEIAGVVCWGHGGFWGTVVRHCPALDLTVAAAVTSTEGSGALEALLDGAVRAWARREVP